MRESSSASALRIVERDLEWSLVALRELVKLLEEATSHLAERESELAHRLRAEAWNIAYARGRGGKPLVSGRALADHRLPGRADRGLAQLVVLDDEFHAALGVLGGHPVAWSLIKRVNGHLNGVRPLGSAQPRYLEDAVAEHTFVLGAAARVESDPAAPAA